MSVVAASAPGKVVLTGEYAVLAGAPAIAVAVNRRARVRFVPGSRELTSVGVVAEGDTGLFDSVVATIGSGTVPAGAFSLDTGAFLSQDAERKLGIGSSAALTVALAGVLGFLSGDTGMSADDRAFKAHEQFQGGAGSGVDIATSLAGGLIEYRRSGRGVRRLSWPEGLHMALIWTGVPASTGSMLAKLDLDTVDFAGLSAAADAAALAWASGDAGAVVAATADYMSALADFDRACEVGITGGGHDVLLAASASDHVVYKPCGAGGGDLGVVLGSDAAEVDQFVAHALERGFERLDAVVDSNGLAVSGTRR